MHCAPFLWGDVGARLFILAIFIASEFGIIYFCFIKAFDKGGNSLIFVYVVLPLWVVISLLWLWSYIVTSWLDAGSVKAALLDLKYPTDPTFFHNIQHQYLLQLQYERIKLQQQMQDAGIQTSFDDSQNSQENLNNNTNNQDINQNNEQINETINDFSRNVANDQDDSQSSRYDPLTSFKELQNVPEFFKYVPICPKCGLPKPERTHHCSTCNLCYFRFDHHCPLIGNCVALNNMKAFMLFLFYSCALMFLASISLIVSCILFKSVEISIAVMIAIFSCVVGAACICFGSQYVPMVCQNVTTLEQIGGIDPVTYDRGRRENVQQIFGKNWIFWFLPTRPDLSGFTWAGYNCYIDNNNNPINYTENPSSSNTITSNLV